MPHFPWIRGLKPRLTSVACTFFGCMLLTPPLAADQSAVPLGMGSYTTRLPAQASRPQAEIYQTERVQGKMPTNDWWSSLAWMKYSERHYPHPLAVEAAANGLRVYYPGPQISATRDAIFAFMPAKAAEDLVLGHSRQAEFPDARVDGFSDWFVSVRFSQAKHQMRVSYGHGSPFVYALFEAGNARLTFSKPPAIWSGDERSAVLGITIGGKHYGLFGPRGSTWAGLGEKALTNQSNAPYFSLAVLPANTKECLSLFTRYAYCHVVDTRVSWAYHEPTAQVTTTFAYTTKAYQGEDVGTLFALYPHQWRHSDAALTDTGYSSVRGTMKLGQGKSFRTTVRFPGVLPALPQVHACDPRRMRDYLASERAGDPPPVKDTYWDGKWLGRMATLIPIAQQYEQAEIASALRDRLQRRLEGWLQSTDSPSKSTGMFYYDDRWGTMIGYPASYGSDTELNDHHFHYGYFIKAAAEIARHDPTWAKDDRWGAMVKMLIRDIACAQRSDPQFPFLRCFDPFAGHSWASGHARFGDGNNNESSSEAMNAWCGLILWGEATGEKAIRNLGIWLYTTEMSAIQEYWFDVHGENFPKSYSPSVVTMVWGGKGANGTWFSAQPEAVHGINWLPLHGGSLYLGHFPAYAEKNYAALVREKGDTNWRQWPDIIWMYRALVNPADALSQFQAKEPNAEFEAGNSRANTYHWIGTLRALGLVDPSVTADDPLYAVFKKGTAKTYVAYNMHHVERIVQFSDGFRLSLPGQGFAVRQSTENPKDGERNSAARQTALCAWLHSPMTAARDARGD